LGIALYESLLTFFLFTNRV
jgi:hAT family C-terminal dimerisation region